MLLSQFVSKMNEHLSKKSGGGGLEDFDKFCVRVLRVVKKYVPGYLLLGVLLNF